MRSANRVVEESSPSEGVLDVLVIGELVIDFISAERTDWLGNAATFRRHLGGSPANIAACVSKLGGSSAVVSKTGIGAFGKFLKGELQRHGVSTDYLIMDHRTNTTIIFVSSTAGSPDFEDFRAGDYLLTPAEVSEEAIERARVVHASTFALSREPCRSAVGKALRLACEGGKDRLARSELQPADLAESQGGERGYPTDVSLRRHNKTLTRRCRAYLRPGL